MAPLEFIGTSDLQTVMESEELGWAFGNAAFSLFPLWPHVNVEVYFFDVNEGGIIFVILFASISSFSILQGPVPWIVQETFPQTLQPISPLCRHAGKRSQPVAGLWSHDTYLPRTT